MRNRTFSTIDGPAGRPVARPQRASVALTELAQLDHLYRRWLSRGELLLHAKDSLDVGTPIEVEVTLGQAVSITLSARVTVGGAEPNRAIMVGFEPMSPFEFDAISSLLRETEAVQRAKPRATSAPERVAPPMMAAGTNPRIEASTRPTQPVSAEHQARLRLEMALALARDELTDGLIDQAGVRFERALEMSPECREAVEGLVEVARRRRDTQVGRLDSLLGRR